MDGKTSLMCVAALLWAAFPSPVEGQARVATDEPVALADWHFDEDQITELRNAHWFDGTRFRSDPLFVKGGRFVEPSAGPANRIIDLEGRYLIPPFADAHTHAFDGSFGFPAQRAQFLQDGIFYALTATAPARSVAKIRSEFSGPQNVDVLTALGGITGLDSHPAEIYEAYALRFYSFEQQVANQPAIRASRKQADNAYYIIEDASDIDAKWPLIAATRPDVIKIYLRNSERFGEDRGDSWAGGGLNPALLAAIADKARAADLRLLIAASSVADFRLAVEAGAAILSHIPCYQAAVAEGIYRSPPDSDEECLIDAADAQSAASANMVTTLITSEWAKERPEWTVAMEDRNIDMLRESGAPLAIGSNAYGSTIIDGLVARAASHTFTNAEILDLATAQTAQAIFPERKIACFDAGCEASFLVLQRNPLEDIQAIRAIEMRIKEGYAVNPETPES
ncbi:hypothetical protein [Sphingorhabdus sp. YGSMI21]|uniref:amidohydrolase family protein n=1 Tax=Sphingorhabdus sp. YGSMI21 TaxID=2077182 RepID=UPI000C1E9A23|nr:hypothetical protein [Sphingorhabdus sp. YGSMI21]ATW04778.1 hypothetical protein CHN51_15465 [Sphingorhabdus sp. YGSMI21]